MVADEVSRIQDKDCGPHSLHDHRPLREVKAGEALMVSFAQVTCSVAAAVGLGLAVPVAAAEPGGAARSASAA
jgi:hypothetical protein